MKMAFVGMGIWGGEGRDKHTTKGRENARGGKRTEIGTGANLERRLHY